MIRQISSSSNIAIRQISGYIFHEPLICRIVNSEYKVIWRNKFLVKTEIRRNKFFFELLFDGFS